MPKSAKSQKRGFTPAQGGSAHRACELQQEVEEEANALVEKRRSSRAMCRRRRGPASSASVACGRSHTKSVTGEPLAV